MPPLVTTLSPFCKPASIFAVCLFCRCIGKKEQEVEDPEDEKDWEESQQGVRGRRRLEEQVENHVVNQ